MEIYVIDGYIQSIFLVEYPDRLLLLDSGCRCDVDSVVDYITIKLNRPISDLKLVLVTHMHPDHAGGAARFQKKYGIPVASLDMERQWYAGPKGSFQHVLDIFLAYWVGHRKKRPLRWLWYPKNLKPDFVIKDGQTIKDFEEWQLILNPGHTDRDFSLYHKLTDSAYLGDVVIKIAKGFLPPVPVNDLDTYRQSIDLISNLKLKRVFLAHGGICSVADEDYLAVSKAAADTPSDRDIAFSIIKGFVKKLLGERR